jgi:acyl-CoA thioesterase YciA
MTTEMTKASHSRQPTVRTWSRPSDINHNGHIFGGWILSQMDIAGGIEATRLCGGAVATVAVEAMKFHQPVLVSDWLSVYTKITKIGTTSVSVDIEVAVLRRDEMEEIKVTEGTFIFVHIDKNGQPTPIPEARKKLTCLPV